jgi:HEAT repeat protein
MVYPEDERVAVAMALSHVRMAIPGGPNSLAVAAFDKLALIGDGAALAEAEAWLASHPLSESYGDRDDDPPDWDLDPAALAALTRWWERLGLVEQRSVRLVADWLGDERAFGVSGWRLFRGTAPLLADRVAPKLLAALPGADAARRGRIADGLGLTPTPAALDALVGLLDDRVESVRARARYALQLSAWEDGGASRAPSTTAALIAALDSPAPRVRLAALGALPRVTGAHRTALRFPALFERALPAIARLLDDPDAEVRRLAVERVNEAGRDLDQLRPSYARAWERAMRLPDDLDLRPLLDDADDDVVRAALSLVGRRGGAAEAAARPAAIARIIALLAAPSSKWLTVKAALHATARLKAVEAIPAVVPYLDERPGHNSDAALVLGQLGCAPARPYLNRMLADPIGSYREDAREALAALDLAESGEGPPTESL